jgi:hypothetical protein
MFGRAMPELLAHLQLMSPLWLDMKLATVCLQLPQLGRMGVGKSLDRLRPGHTGREAKLDSTHTFHFN